MIKVSSTAMKLIFEEKDDETSNKVPLYRQLGNRQMKAVFKPRQLHESYDDLDLGAEIQVSKQQEEKWTQHVNQMINQVKNEFGPSKVKPVTVEDMTYE